MIRKRIVTFMLLINVSFVNTNLIISEDKYKLVRLSEFILSGYFERNYVRGAIQCCQACSLDERCTLVRFYTQSKICELYPRQFLTLSWSVSDSVHKVYTSDEIYLELVKSPLSWDNAKHACDDKGGRLVVIQTEEDRAEIANLLLNMVVIGADYDYAQPWIGGNDLTTEGSFAWIDGTAVSWSLQWTQDQPDNSNDGEDCLHLFRYSGFKLNDIPCSSMKWSICEYY